MTAPTIAEANWHLKQLAESNLNVSSLLGDMPRIVVMSTSLKVVNN